MSPTGPAPTLSSSGAGDARRLRSRRLRAGHRGRGRRRAPVFERATAQPPVARAREARDEHLLAARTASSWPRRAATASAMLWLPTPATRPQLDGASGRCHRASSARRKAHRHDKPRRRRPCLGRRDRAARPHRRPCERGLVRLLSPDGLIGHGQPRRGRSRSGKPPPGGRARLCQATRTPLSAPSSARTRRGGHGQRGRDGTGMGRHDRPGPGTDRVFSARSTRAVFTPGRAAESWPTPDEGPPAPAGRPTATSPPPGSSTTRPPSAAREPWRLRSPRPRMPTTIRLWSDFRTQALAAFVSLPAAAVAVEFDPSDETLVVVCGRRRRARILDAASGAESIAFLRRPAQLIADAVVQSRRVASSPPQATTESLGSGTANNGELLLELKGHVDALTALPSAPMAERSCTAERGRAMRRSGTRRRVRTCELLRGHFGRCLRRVLQPGWARGSLPPGRRCRRSWEAETGQPRCSTLSGHFGVAHRAPPSARTGRSDHDDER